MTDFTEALNHVLRGAVSNVESEYEQHRPRTLRSARVLQLREVLERVTHNSWSAGDLVTPARDAGVNPAYVGEPHIVIRVRDFGDVRCSHVDNLYQIAGIDRDGDVQTAWCAEWQLERYDEASNE